MKKELSFGSFVSTVFSCFVVLIPILQYYKSIIPSFNLATLLAILFIPLLVIAAFVDRHRYKKINSWPVYLYVVFIVFNVLITFSRYNYGYSWNSIGPFIRFLVLFLSIFCLGRNVFNIRKAFRCLELFLLASAILIVFSTLLKSFAGVVINFRIDLLLSDSGYTGTSNDRFAGFFMEPAHFAQSAALYLSFSLFSKNYISIKKWKTLLIVVGVVFSGSGQGYLFLALLLMLFVGKIVFIEKKTQNSILILSSLLLLIAISLPILYQLPFIKNAISRIIDTEGGLGGAALEGRTFSNHLFNQLSSNEKMFGLGYGHIDLLTDGYVNSLFLHLIECGYISIPFLILLMVYPFVRGNGSIKVYTILFSIMLFFTGIWAPMTLFPALLFAYSSPRVKKELTHNEKQFEFIEINRAKTNANC